MRKLRKKIFVTAGYNTVYMGPGRKEFHPKKNMRLFEEYIREAAQGTCNLLPRVDLDEGVVGNFMAARFLKQGNLPGFLPYAVPELRGKPCSRLEGACGSGGLALSAAIKSVLAELADTVLVLGFEVQHTMKSVYGADVLAGAGYYNGFRKNGHAYYFPGIFSDRAQAYGEKYGIKQMREGLAKWYELSIVNARKNPNAQEYHNTTEDLFELGMTSPDPKNFVPHLNLYDCSKVSDGASCLIIASEEGLQRLGIEKELTIEVIGLYGSEGDLTEVPEDLTRLENTANAAQGALTMADISREDLGILELHDCFSISGILALESLGFAKPGEGPAFVGMGHTASTGTIPINLSGGLGGFGHPVGATGVRQMVDLYQQFTGSAPNSLQSRKNYGMMISMGGNDKTVTALVVKSTAA